MLSRGANAQLDSPATAIPLSSPGKLVRSQGTGTTLGDCQVGSSGVGLRGVASPAAA